MDYWGGAGKGYVAPPPSKIIGGGAAPPLLTPMDDNEKMYASEPRLRLANFPSPAEIEPVTARSALHPLSYGAFKLAKIIFGQPIELGARKQKRMIKKKAGEERVLNEKKKKLKPECASVQSGQCLHC